MEVVLRMQPPEGRCLHAAYTVHVYGAAGGVRAVSCRTVHVLFAQVGESAGCREYRMRGGGTGAECVLGAA